MKRHTDEMRRVSGKNSFKKISIDRKTGRSLQSIAGAGLFAENEKTWRDFAVRTRAQTKHAVGKLPSHKNVPAKLGIATREREFVPLVRSRFARFSPATAERPPDGLPVR